MIEALTGSYRVVHVHASEHRMSRILTRNHRRAVPIYYRFEKRSDDREGICRRTMARVHSVSG